MAEQLTETRLWGISIPTPPLNRYEFYGDWLSVGTIEAATEEEAKEKALRGEWHPVSRNGIPYEVPADTFRFVQAYQASMRVDADD